MKERLKTHKNILCHECKNHIPGEIFNPILYYGLIPDFFPVISSTSTLITAVCFKKDSG